MNDLSDPFRASEPGEDAAASEAVTSAPAVPTSATQPAPVEPSDADAGAAADSGDGLLDRLEADLAAVDTAIATLDAIAADGPGGEPAAAEIAAAVSPERFGALEP